MAGESTLRGLARDHAARPRRGSRYGAALREPRALLGALILLALGIVGVLAPPLAPYHPPIGNDLDYFLNERFALAHSPPFWDRSADRPFDLTDPFADFTRSLPHDPAYLLGTDSRGRDVQSLLAYGIRYCLALGLVATALVALAGLVIGVLAGWLGGAWEAVVMRATDAIEAVPALILWILAAAVLSGPLGSRLDLAGLGFDGVSATALALASVGWAPVARLVRAQVLGLKAQEWVLAARATGVPEGRILLRHLVPHTVGTVLVAASAQLPVMLLTDGFLGVIEVGQRPSMDSLGEMIIREFPYMVQAPIFVLIPTALIILISLAMTLLSDGIRRALDPQRLG